MGSAPGRGGRRPRGLKPGCAAGGGGGRGGGEGGGLEGDTLTIWAGEKGSPAYFRGVFSGDGNTMSGQWFYPDGGGYDSTMTRSSA